MLKRIQIAVLLLVSMCGIARSAHGQQPTQQPISCPGQNSLYRPTNLACELQVATRGYQAYSKVEAVSSIVGTQLGQLPISTAVTGSGLTFNKSLGVFTASEDSLGTILTQRGETIGRHTFMAAFTYQHYGFGSIDGIRLKDFPTTSVVTYSNGATTYEQATSNVDLSIDQYTALVSFGLTSKLDLAVVVPISRVSLSTRTQVTYYPFTPPPDPQSQPTFGDTNNYPGSASGIGDVTVVVKGSLYSGEKTKVAAGGEVRFPSGDEANYLGTGAYGFKPYVIVSRSGRFTPNVNVGYQWNGTSILNGKDNLPASLQYSGGADFRVNRHVTLVGEFVGQYVINSQRMARTTIVLPGQVVVIPGYLPPYNAVQTYKQNYSMNNLGGGIKFSPFRRLIVNASVLFKLDNAGLRSTVTPLAGISYRFH